MIFTPYTSYKVSLLVIHISLDSDQQHHKHFPPGFQTGLPSSRSADSHMTQHEENYQTKMMPQKLFDCFVLG
jgi:hypothetical protein